MIDLEIPQGKRTKQYRFFEMVPAIISYGSIITLVVLSLINPLWASAYLLLVIITMVVKAVGIAFHTIRGRKRLDQAQKIDWKRYLTELEDPETSFAVEAKKRRRSFDFKQHQENLRLVAAAPETFPIPSRLYNAVIIAAYNETDEVLIPTIQSLINTHYDKDHLIVFLAYEQRGGAAMKATAKRLERRFKNEFFHFQLAEHPSDLPNEVIGKGGNITYAGRALQSWLDKKSIRYQDVIVTSLDSDNRPHASYFDYVTYEYIVHDNRKHLSYQPISLFLNNIWDVPAPMRVVATGNSFWNVIVSMRPHLLRNFASHSQPMDALVEMDFWSTRTIVEDGHQYWRSYFYFGGNYAVTPIYVPIYQDAVLASTYVSTLKAQFVQLRRWAYGASDVPYVASHIFTRQRNVPLLGGLARLLRLLDGHITLASVSILIAIGGWVPLLLYGDASRSVTAHQLPEVISIVQRVAMVGLFITIFVAFRMLPPRPERYKRHRTVFMISQWLLMPIIAIGYNAMAAYYSQTRLATGRYLDKFDVTEKATVDSVERKKRAKAARRASR